MPCKIQIKQNITSKIEASTNAALGKSLDVAQSIAREVNDAYKTPVVRFVQRGTDLIDRVINVPQNLIDKYYDNELALEEEDARRVQREDARRAGEDYTDRYMFQLEQPDVTETNQLSLFGETDTTMRLKNGRDYKISEIDGSMLEDMGYTKKEVIQILKNIC